MDGKFQPEVCMKLQNMGSNAQGYRSAVLGGPQCSAPPPATAGEVLTWGREATFTLDCTHSQGGGGSAGSGEFLSLLSGRPDAVGVAGRLQAAAAKAASDLTAAMQRSFECTLGVATGKNGGTATSSGAVLHHTRALHVLTGPRLNAVRLRACNAAPALAQQQQHPAAPAHAGNATTLRAHSLKLNGKRLLSGDLATVQASSSSEACRVLLVRVPMRSLSDGFVLSGAIALAGTGPWGVGDMVSIEMQVGEVHLLHASSGGSAGWAEAEVEGAPGGGEDEDGP